MKTFFCDLVLYDYSSNNEVIEAMVNNKEQVSIKCIQLMSHIVNVHQIWNLKIQPGETPNEPWLNHSIENLQTINQANYEQSQQIIDHFDLNHIIQWKTKNSQVFTNSIQDILFQIINHSNYHRAQIATEFKLSAIQPLLTDFIYYKMKSTNQK